MESLCGVVGVVGVDRGCTSVRTVGPLAECGKLALVG